MISQLSKVICAKCGKEEDHKNLTTRMKIRLNRDPKLKYTCGSCIAERAQKIMEDTFDKTFGGHK